MAYITTYNKIKKKDREIFNREKYIFLDFLENSFDYEDIYSGKIDKSLLDIIMLLNGLKFYTQFCCSCIEEEHNDKKDYIKQGQEGYIVFSVLNKTQKSQIKEIVEKSGLKFKNYKLIDFPIEINNNYYSIKIKDKRSIIYNPFSNVPLTSEKNIKLNDRILKKRWNKFRKELVKLQQRKVNNV